MNRREIKHLAWEMTKKYFGFALIVLILNMIIMGALSSTGVGIIFTGTINVGMACVFVNIIRDKKGEISDLFCGLKNFAETMIAGILVNLFAFLWSLLFVIPGIIKSYSYAMTYFIMNDNPSIGAIEAITESRKMMNGHKWSLFILDLSFIGWHLLSIFTLGLLYIWVIPYITSARAAFYESIRGEIEGSVASNKEVIL